MGSACPDTNPFYQNLAPLEWQKECAGIVLPIRPSHSDKKHGPVRTNDGPVQFPKGSSSSNSNRRPVGNKRPLSPEEVEAVKKLEKRVKRYLPVELDVDTSYLNNTQEQVLESLINAASYMNDIFEMQVWKGSKDKKEQLEDEMDWNELARLQLQYWDIMKGPWDRTDENKPFAIDRTKPEGAGFYSEGLSYKEFKVWMQLDQKAGKDQGKFQVNFKKLENSVKDRVKQYVTLQHSGDKEAVEKLLAKYGVV